jgi:hypothetical protein
VTLTIGIPTYERAATVTHVVHRLLAHPSAGLVEILVIDDGSTDATAERLTADPVIAERVRVLRNERNLGYPRTFARVFAECATDHVMFVADDDHVIADILPALIDHLETERPAFASPQFLRGDAVYRGRPETGPIVPEDFLAASAHASGLVYRVDACEDALRTLATRLDADESDAVVYPQVVVLIELLVAGRACEWLALPTVLEGLQEPSGIRDAGGLEYWSVESRWRQLKSFDAALSDLVERDRSGVAAAMLAAQRKRVFHAMTSAMRGESPALGAAFDAGAQRHYADTPTSSLRSRVAARLRR